MRAEMEDLVRSSLLSLGAQEIERADGVTRYQLVDGLIERLGRQELLVTFNSAVAAHRPDVELISAGSFLYDLILRLVRERGRAAGGWLPAAPDLDCPALIARLGARLNGRRFTRQKAVWGTTYLFSFRLGFYFDTPHEKLYTVRVDFERNRVRHETHPGRLVESAVTASPLPDLPVRKSDPERAFRMAWERVEEEVARLTEKYRQQGEAHLAEEIRTIEQYYRQLIEEEKRAREQKNTRRGRDESDERIELLKLEWDRRIAEEKARLSPDVSVALSCASRLHVPLEKWRAHGSERRSGGAGRTPDRRAGGTPRPGAERRGAAADFWVDLHAAEAWPAPVPRRKRGAAEKPPVRPRLTLVEPLPADGAADDEVDGDIDDER